MRKVNNKDTLHLSNLGGQTGHFAEGILQFKDLAIPQFFEFLQNSTNMSLIV